MKQKTGRKLLAFLLTLALVVGLMPGMSLTAYAADTTITWDSSVVNSITLDEVNESYNNSGITVQMTAKGWVGSFSNNEMAGSATFVFSSTVGNIKGITINADNTGLAPYDGWTKGSTTVTWSGTPASSVTLIGNPISIKNISSIVFTIEGANVDVAGVTLNKTETTLTVGGDPVTLTATIAPNDATDKTVKWSVGGTNANAVKLYSDETCTTEVGTNAVSTLTVYARGMSAGSATVTVTSNADSEKKASCDVTVNAPVTKYPLWVGGTQVTSANAGNILGDGTASYDANTHTLQLNGFNYTGPGSIYTDFANQKHHAAICYTEEYDGSLEIKLIGNNTVSCNASGNQFVYGIYDGRNTGEGLIISGEGSLNVSASEGAIYGYGISSYNTITFKSGTVTATSTGPNGRTINARNVTISGGTVTTVGKLYGIHATGTTTISGGTVDAEGRDGIRGDRVVISGGTVKAAGTGYYGIVLGSNGVVEIGANVGSVTVSGKDAAIDNRNGNRVINAVSGTGWTDMEGTEGQEAIAISAAGQSLDYKKVQFPGESLPPAEVTTKPTAKTLTYTGSAQELVTAGTPSGGTMQYALGTNATTAPTEGWSDSIPAKTDVGTYFVWYKAAGDAEHSDSAPQCVPAKISPDGKYLVYNGTAQALVSAGEATGGTMQYALGTDDKTAPAEGWGEAIPTGTNAGTYYVWYKVTGDQNHNDSEQACVEATIAKKGLTVTADAKSKTQGEADPALTYTAEGLVGSDTLTGALSREAGEDPGTYAITQGTLTAGDNYEITFTSAVLTINKKDEPAPAPSGGGGGYYGGGGGYYGGGTVQNQRRDAYSDVIGAAATSFRDSSPERIHNIELACEKLDGIVLQPGEVFSFNEAVGGLTAEAGFEVAPVNPKDESTAEMAGGVSQVSSALYSSSLFALLETVERTNHPFAVPFIQPGTDAYVTDPGNADALDLKFRNTRGEPIRISAKTRVDEARQVREIVIELRSALGSSDYMPIRFDNTWGGDQNAFLTETPYDLTRPGYRILLTHEEQQFTDASGAGIRTLTHRKILDAAGMLVRDEILNSKLPDGSYAMDTYYQG